MASEEILREVIRKLIKESIIKEDEFRGAWANKSPREKSKYYKNLLADVEDGLNELVNIGEDYQVFQSAKHAAKALKQAYKLVNSVK